MTLSREHSRDTVTLTGLVFEKPGKKFFRALPG